MRKRRYYLAALVTALSQSFLLGQSFPPPKPLTDEERILVVLQDLEDAIVSQDLVRLLDCFSFPLGHDDTTSRFEEVHSTLMDIFDHSSERRKAERFQELTPPGANLTGTWDFELEIDTVRFLNEQSAQVRVWAYFLATQPYKSSEWDFEKKHREDFLLRKNGGEWRIHGVGHLLKLIRTFGNLVPTE